MAFLTAVVDDRVPVAVGFGLVPCRYLKRKSAGVLDAGTTIESRTGNPHYHEFNCQNISLLAGWIVGGSTMHRTDRGTGKGLGVEVCGLDGVSGIPNANCVSGWCHAFCLFISDVLPVLHLQ